MIDTTRTLIQFKEYKQQIILILFMMMALHTEDSFKAGLATLDGLDN